jgi:hypothetical protein
MDGRIISNVDQSAIKDWDMRRVGDELYLAERAGKWEGENTYTKAVANEHERRARQPESSSPVDDCVPRSVGPPAGRHRHPAGVDIVSISAKSSH